MKISHKWHIFIFSFLFSFLLWVSVNLGGKYQTYIKVKIEAINLPEGKTLLEPLPEKIDVLFNGTGWQLASMFFNPNLKCEIDLSKLTRSNFIVLKDEINHVIKLPNNVQPLHVFPESLFVKLDDNIEKKVPIIPNVFVECENGYGIMGKIALNPKTIKIIGPKSIVNNIQFWKTAYAEYKNVKENITTIIPLFDTLNGIVKLSNEMVGINIEIQMLAEQLFENIPITLIDFPEKENISILPNKVDVLVRSGIEKLANFDRSKIKVYIKYEQIKKDTLGYLIPQIKLPEEYNVIRIKPNKIEYIIRK